MSDKYTIEANKGLFVVIDIRNKQNVQRNFQRYKNDHEILKRLATFLNIKFVVFESFDNICPKFWRKLMFKEFLFDVATFSNNHSNEIDCLMLFLLADCENVEKDIKFKFYENNPAGSMEIRLGDITSPFLPNNCEGLVDKPKMIFINALETFRDQDKEIYIEQDFTKPLKVSKYEAFSGFQSLLKLNGTVNNYTPNHADFFICISRPKAVVDTKGPYSLFLKILWSVIKQFPQYEINQIVMVLNREMVKNSYKIDGINYSYSRFWSSSRLRKKLYLCKQIEKTTENFVDQ